ncbi:uncharacterized protein CLUP02_03463 [Colletotrichum lupini]|uniref:Uncharacterized protein n=1 Tax=Colletotrichum lupini TaxID=145971 RepID=A0A9Q8WCV4_9PEZI|nr:uncharacterized protein CLUP02_03463 [Colletotrichum lupini]UQC77990.1 hypothetical protein CLUP02_03463 [Colletotrichum lupini]
MQREETQRLVDSDPVTGDEASENTQSMVQSIDTIVGRWFASACLFCGDTSDSKENGKRTRQIARSRRAAPESDQSPFGGHRRMQNPRGNLKEAKEWASHAGVSRCLSVSLFLVDPTGIERRTGLGETVRNQHAAGDTELKQFQPWPQLRWKPYSMHAARELQPFPAFHAFKSRLELALTTTSHRDCNTIEDNAGIEGVRADRWSIGDGRWIVPERDSRNTERRQQDPGPRTDGL